MNNETDSMEMPCLCDCGRWFDLHDGYGSRYSSSVVCKTCHKREDEIIDLERRIEDLEELGNKKREIKKLRKQLEELQQMI